MAKMKPSFKEEKEKKIKKLKRFEECLRPYKVIRDAVHGDIWITELEAKIIDTEIFQRLRRIRQLGPSYMVYPSATHTRFEHSLGTLHITQQIIDAINKNWESTKLSSDITFCDKKMDAEDILVTRLVALLHDLAHLSFGHTLEDEGELFPKKQWLHTERSEILWNEVKSIVKNYLLEKGIEKKTIDNLISEIKNVLEAEEKGEEDTKKLKRPYIADIVGNTICADLLDYVKRDAYFTGLSFSYDKRLISYFVIKEFGEKKRVAILLERKPKIVRKDILSYCIDLLKLRYSLAEKVYYHRVKTILSAMVIKCIHRAMKSNLINLNDLLSLGDDVLLWKIVQGENNKSEDAKIAKELAYDILNRNIYGCVYHDEEPTPTFRNLIDNYRKKKSDML